ncbi:MAG: YesL family protein [Aggregatilineales bacterium]
MALRLPAPLRVFRQALIDWWDAWLPLMLINLAWIVCIFTIVLAPPAVFALYAAAHEIAHGRTVNIQDFVAELRRYFFQSWRWAIPNVVLIFLAGYGLIFYGERGGEIGFVLQLLVLLVLAGWATVQFYALPYLVAQVDRRLIVAWRNGLYTALASPFYTLAVMLLAGLLAAFNAALVLPSFIGGACLFALFGTRAVFERLDTFGIRREQSPNMPPSKSR